MPARTPPCHRAQARGNRRIDEPKTFPHGRGDGCGKLLPNKNDHRATISFRQGCVQLVSEHSETVRAKVETLWKTARAAANYNRCNNLMLDLARDQWKLASMRAFYTSVSAECPLPKRAGPVTASRPDRSPKANVLLSALADSSTRSLNAPPCEHEIGRSRGEECKVRGNAADSIHWRRKHRAQIACWRLGAWRGR